MGLAFGVGIMPVGSVRGMRYVVARPAPAMQRVETRRDNETTARRWKKVGGAMDRLAHKGEDRPHCPWTRPRSCVDQPSSDTAYATPQAQPADMGVEEGMRLLGRLCERVSQTVARTAGARHGGANDEAHCAPGLAHTPPLGAMLQRGERSLGVSTW